MKKIFVIAFAIASALSLIAGALYADGSSEGKTTAPGAATAGAAAKSLYYVEAKSFNNIPAITVAGIADFSRLIADYNVRHVFFTGSAFLFQAPSIAYPFTIPSNGYKSIADYAAGEGKAFKDGASFYYAAENQLTSQAEVDYYRKEAFFYPDDYRKAQRTGFVNPGSVSRMNRITGVMSEKDLQANIRYANAIIWLLYYQQTDPVREFLANKDIDKLLLPFTNNRSYPNYIVRIKPGYYFVNLSLSGLRYQDQDSVFFYACMFGLYASLADYTSAYNSSQAYTVKNSETTARAAGYASFQECLGDVNQLMGNTGRSSPFGPR